MADETEDRDAALVAAVAGRDEAASVDRSTCRQA
jgi:hypothetical protein